MRLGMVPRPMIDTQMAFTLGRVIMAGADLGVFRVLADGPATAAEVAERLGTDPHATGKLLFALGASDYLRFHDGRYELTKVARKWLLPRQPERPHRQAALSAHRVGPDGPHRGVRAHRTAARHSPHGRPGDVGLLPARDARDGGVLLRGVRQAHARARRGAGPARHRWLPRLLLRRAVPASRGPARGRPRPARGGREVRAAARRRGHGRPRGSPHRQRADRRPGGGGLGRRDDRAGRPPFQRRAEPRARGARGPRPTPGRRVRDPRRLPPPPRPGEAGQLPSLLEFYFALTSQSGTWTPEEMSGWQRAAGLQPKRPIRLRTAPGGGIQAAVQPGRATPQLPFAPA